MKRISDDEKQKLGIIIHYYRNQYFKSNNINKEDYKQTNFCKDICSQAQLSRLERGEPLKDNEIYFLLLDKLNLQFEKVAIKEFLVFETYFEDILSHLNNDNLVINYNEYVMLINKYQNIFRKNILYTHYNYALEFILYILNEDFKEAEYLIEEVENTLDILPEKFLVLTLHHLGIYYNYHNNYQIAVKYFLIAIEHMNIHDIKNPLIYVDSAYNFIKMNRVINALKSLDKALLDFENSENIYILEKIYRYYALGYLKERYYDDCHDYIEKAYELIKNSMRYDLLINLYYLSALCYYSNKNRKRAIEELNKAQEIKYSEKVEILLIIINYKIKKIIDDKSFNNKNYELIKNLFFASNKEQYYEENLDKNLKSFEEELKLFIVDEMYHIYKENKKYKKAIELFEKYLY